MAVTRSRSRPLASPPPRPHRFFKIFIPKLSSHRLAIPLAFARHVQAEPPRAVSLTGPSGRTWSVGLKKDGDRVALVNGWREFAADHSLGLGDFLVFRYDGDSRFTVLVFDPSACEKPKAFDAKPGESPHVAAAETDGEDSVKEKSAQEARRAAPKRNPKKQNEEDSVKEISALEARRAALKRKPKKENEEVVNGSVRKKPKHNRSSAPENSRARLDSSSAKKKSQSNQKAPTRSSPRHVPRPQTSSIAPKDTTKAWSRPSSSGDHDILKLPGGCFTSRRRTVTTEEKHRAVRMAGSFKSRNPSAMVVMRDTYVYRYFNMHLPYNFMMNHLPRVSRKLTLWDPNGRPWPVSYRFYCRVGGYRACFRAGWKMFSYANNLEKGDVCVFELCSRDHIQVHIYRVVEKLTPLS